MLSLHQSLTSVTMTISEMKKQRRQNTFYSFGHLFNAGLILGQ